MDITIQNAGSSDLHESIRQSVLQNSYKYPHPFGPEDVVIKTPLGSINANVRTIRHDSILVNVASAADGAAASKAERKSESPSGKAAAPALPEGVTKNANWFTYQGKTL